MNKKSILSIMLVVAMLFAVGCTKTGSVYSVDKLTQESLSLPLKSNGTVSTQESLSLPLKSNGTVSSQKANLWTTYSTEKVVQNRIDNSISVINKDEQLSVDISLMQNETEGIQLIVSALQNIKSYSISTTGFSDGKGHRIGSDKVKIYHQEYTTIDTKFSNYANIKVGDAIPDMLLPMDLAIESGENHIKSGNNQGVTIEVKTESNTVAGEYFGNFVLKLDNEEITIPSHITVWDFGYVGKRTFQSCFLLYRKDLMNYEYDTSDEMVDSYIDFLLDYKINTYVIETPFPTPEKYVEEIKERFANDNYNSIIIPNFFPLDMTLYDASGSVSNTARSLIDYIKAITKASTEQTPYIEYAYFYPSNLDEADAVELKMVAAKRILSKGGVLDQILARAVFELKNEGYFNGLGDDFAKRIENAILNIPAIFTNTKFVDSIVGDELSSIFCPVMNVLDEGMYRDRYQESVLNSSNGNFWTYTCVGPQNPYPSFHLDDTSLGSRVSGWMEKAYNINGYLYWSLAASQLSSEWLDVYSSPARFKSASGLLANGDGFLMYPGKLYNSEKPFATIRLTAHRDSMEDYDMLCVYENLLRERAKSFGLEEEFNFNDYVADLYNSLFVGSIYKDEDELVIKAREELAERILDIKQESKMFYIPNKAEADSKLIIYSEYSTLNIDGNLVGGKKLDYGYEYTVTVNQTKDIAVKDEKSTYSLKLNKYYNLTNFSTANINNFIVTDGSEKVIKGNTISLLLKSQYKDAGEKIGSQTKLFRPSITFMTNTTSVINDLYFEVNNTGDTKLEFYVTLIFDNGEINVDSAYIGVNERKNISMHINDEGYNWSKLKGIRISFSNIITNSEGVNVLSENRKFEVSDIFIK